MLRIIVCMKQVIDPETPVSSIKVNPETMRVIPPKGTPPVLNPFDENALEASLKIKDAQSANITVLSMGRSLAKQVLKKSLAAGADNLICLEDDVFEDFALDSFSTACVLAEAIKKIGKYDLILCGRQASDTNAGVVGSGIAEILGIPSMIEARKIEVTGTMVRVQRPTPDGYQVIESPMPVLVTASNEVGELRPATLNALIAAQKKETIIWNARDLSIELSNLKRPCLRMLFQPVHEGKCEIIEGRTPVEAGINLALRLKEASIL